MKSIKEQAEEFYDKFMEDKEYFGLIQAPGEILSIDSCLRYFYMEGLKAGLERMPEAKKEEE